MLAARPWYEIDLPSDVVNVPTMLSYEERKLLYWLARDYATGDAAIVDAGCFLGGSTVSILVGLRDRTIPWAGPAVASYDRFRIEDYTIPQFFADDPTARPGRSFRDRFEANTAGLGVPHVTCDGDVMEIGWDGGPIEILFLDLVKSWKINDAILRDFFPCLVPGKSVIVQQDYGWGSGPWIHIAMELLSESVSLVDGMKAGSHVFFVERDLPGEVLQRGLRGLSHDRQLELMDSAAHRVCGWARGMVELARTAVIADRDGSAAAAREVEAIAERYTDPFVQLCVSYVRDSLETDASAAAVRHGARVASGAE